MMALSRPERPRRGWAGDPARPTRSRVRGARALPPRLLLVALALAMPLGSMAGPAGAAGLIQPRIFNGVVTFAHPFAGLLLERRDASAPWLSRCTLSLIGPRTALTAAHCVCDAHGSLCQPGKRYAPDPGTLRALFQTGGMVAVASVSIPNGFDFPEQDFALIHLATPLAGVTPVALAEVSPAFGTAAQIVGFGSTSGLETNTGVKRSGPVVTTSCDGYLADAAFVCWQSDGGPTGANTCPGDSGAPLLVDDGAGGPLLAGVASGGYGACDGEDLAFATSLAAHRAAILTLAGGDAVTAGPPRAVAQARVREGTIGPGAPELVLSIPVAEGTARLVAVGNAEDDGGNDFVLRLARGTPPTAVSPACVSDLGGVFESCVVDDPESGTWYASYGGGVGLGGLAQLSLTSLGATCTLDLDGDGRADALTDGLLLVRHLAGRTGADLVAGVLAPGASRTDPAAIGALLDGDACVLALDVDLDGARDASTDGLLVLRYLFGLRGDALVNGALGAGAARTDAGEIAAALGALE